MGETGCGKTRLIQFMCDLQATEAERIGKTSFENIIIMKVTFKLVIRVFGAFYCCDVWH